MDLLEVAATCVPPECPLDYNSPMPRKFSDAPKSPPGLDGPAARSVRDAVSDGADDWPGITADEKDYADRMRSYHDECYQIRQIRNARRLAEWRVNFARELIAAVARAEASDAAD